MWKIKFLVILSITLSVNCFGSWLSSRPDGPNQVNENVKIIFTPNKTFAYWMPMRDFSSLPLLPDFNRDLPTTIYFHGWLENGTMDLSTVAIRGAYLDVGGYNVLTADWGYYSKQASYQNNVIPQMKVIAETFAQNLVDFFALYDIKKFHLVGHSLGGQMVAKIGRHIAKITSGKMTIPAIFALDPAGPGFGFNGNHYDGMEPIQSSDADYVQVIHTSGGMLGMEYRCGNVDFYPNGGQYHPGCDMDAGSKLMPMSQFACQHYRSWHFFQESLRKPKAFPAVRCGGYEDFLNINKGGKCFKDDIEYMGFYANRNASGKYFLSTYANLFNLGRFEEGLEPDTSSFEKMPVPPRKVQSDNLSPNYYINGIA